MELAASGYDNKARTDFAAQIQAQGWHVLHGGEDENDNEGSECEAQIEEGPDNEAPPSSGGAIDEDAVDTNEQGESEDDQGPSATEVAADRLLAERRRMARKTAMAQASRNAAKDKRHNSRRSVSSSMSFGW